MSVTVTYNYVYYPGGPGQTRQPRSNPGPGGFTLINSLPGGTYNSGDQFAVGSVPPTKVVNGQTCIFAFTNVSGGIPPGQSTPSGVTSFGSDTPPPAVTVGSSPIVVLVVYAYLSAGSGSGAWIDSFDETTGLLFNDTFVTVSPDSGGLLTNGGNVKGFVNTATASETITALTPTSPTGVVFDQWVILYPQTAKGTAGITVSGTNLAVSKGTSVYALAFYKALTSCQQLLQSFNALEPKTNEGLLAWYEKGLSACQGPQYTTAVNEIKAILRGLGNAPKPPQP